MSEASRWRVPDEVLAAEMEGEAVLLHMETKDYFCLNETAAAVWKGLGRGLDREGLVGLLLDEFEVERPTAEAELDRLLAELEERGLVVAEPGEAG